MLSFKTDTTLLRCGIDSEHIERFSKWDQDGNTPSPLIFSNKEIKHCSSLEKPYIGFCVSFCCKEAVFKALEGPYDFTECELLWIPGHDNFQCNLNDELLNKHQIKNNRICVELTENNESIVTVYLLGK